MSMLRGDTNGTYIVDLRKDSDNWTIFVLDQAAHLRACEQEPGGSYMFGYYQHPKVQPMYGRGGDDAFQEARDAWNAAVDAEVHKTPLQSFVEETFRDN